MKMFKKKKCGNCGKKITKDYLFCPYCSNPLKKNSRNSEGDWGMLGRDDIIPSTELGLPMGFSTLFNTLLKNLNKQIGEFDNTKSNSDKSKIKKGGIGISIYTSGNKPPEIKVTSFGNVPEFKEKERAIKSEKSPLNLPKINSKKFPELPKKEPETMIRRLSNKIIYEINLPEVKSIRDVSIVQLEKSIEIKALAKNFVYQKIIPVNFPIKKYNLLKEKLVLELDAKD